VKTFEHSDSRLRGFCAVQTLAYTTIVEDGGGNVFRSSKVDVVDSPYYEAKYRLLCGKGFGSFHVWHVTLSFMPDSSGETSGLVRGHWELSMMGNIGGGAITFGCLSTLESGITHVLSLGVEKSVMKAFPCRSEQVDASAEASGAEGSLAPTTSSKSNNVKFLRASSAVGSMSVDCASCSGAVLFGGTEKLSVHL
jgi:hypothetical protein